MFGLGTIINVAAIVAGGFIGIVFKRFIKERYQDTINKATGVSVIALGASGCIAKILVFNPQTNGFETQKTLMMIFSMVIGAVVGEIIDIDGKFESFGTWLRKKSGNENDNRFLDAFLTASFTVCIGAMAIIGSVQDGIYGDHSTLMAKAVLDFAIILIMASSMGKGCIFSAIPVGIFQGSITILSRFIEPFMTTASLNNISLVGSILIACVGINLVWPRTVKVANLLPSVIVAAILK